MAELVAVDGGIRRWLQRERRRMLAAPSRFAHTRGRYWQAMAQIGQQRSDIALLHRRAGFGASPDELDRLAPGGYEAAVEHVLSQLTAPNNAADAVPLPAFTDFEQPDPTPDSATKRQAQQARDQQRRQEGAALVE